MHTETVLSPRAVLSGSTGLAQRVTCLAALFMEARVVELKIRSASRGSRNFNNVVRHGQQRQTEETASPKAMRDSLAGA